MSISQIPATWNHPRDPNPQQYTRAGEAKQWEKGYLRLETFCVVKKRRKMGQKRGKMQERRNILKRGVLPMQRDIGT